MAIELLGQQLTCLFFNFVCLIIPISSRVKEDYYGRKLNGPNLNKLLKNAVELTAFLPESLKKFGQTLQKLDRMKKSILFLNGSGSQLGRTPQIVY